MIGAGGGAAMTGGSPVVGAAIGGGGGCTRRRIDQRQSRPPDLALTRPAERRPDHRDPRGGPLVQITRPTTWTAEACSGGMYSVSETGLSLISARLPSSLGWTRLTRRSPAISST